MSAIIGYVSQQEGTTKVTYNNGSDEALASHTSVHMNDIIETGNNGTVILVLENGNTLRIGPDQHVILDETVYEEELAQDETEVEVAALQALLEETGNIEDLEETAAGEETVEGSGTNVTAQTEHIENLGDAYAEGLPTINPHVTEPLEPRQINEGEPANNFSAAFIPESVDTTAPAVDVTDIMLTNDNTPQISGTVDDVTATVIVTIGGVNYPATNNGDGTWILADDAVSTLADGTTTVNVSATDVAGNEGTGSGTVTVDTTAPDAPAVELTTDSGTAGDLITNDGTLTVTPNEATSTIEYSTDGGVSWSTTAPTATEGENSVSLREVDEAGNPSAATDITFTLDTTAPAVDVTDITLTNDNTPELTGTVDDATATVVVTIGTIDYTATNNGDGTWILADDAVSILADGITTVNIAATDVAGNEGTGSGTVTVDTTAPDAPAVELTTDSGTAGDLITNDGTLTVTPNEATSTIEYSTDGGVSWSTTAPTATEGENSVSLREVDEAGNPSAATDITFTLDTTAPAVDVTDITLTNDNTPELTGTVDDATATVVVTIGTIDYTATNNGDGTWILADDAVSILADGITTVNIAATDVAGNEGTGSGTVTVDTTAPDAPAVELTTDSGTAGDLITNDGTLTVTPNEATSTIEYSTDGGVSWSTTAPTATEGENSVSLREVDEAGNPSAATDITFTLDTTAPAVDVTDIMLTNDNTPQISGTVDDVTATVIVTIGGVNYPATNNGDGTWILADDAVSTLADGTTTVNVSATDVAGNEGTGSGTVTVDTTAPGNDDTALLDEGASVVIDVAANDLDASGVDLSTIDIDTLPANGAVVVNSDGTVTYTHNGSETASDSFTYTIADNAGNVSDPVTVGITVDPVNDAPTFTMTTDAATVMEGALPGANEDTTGTPDTVVYTGTFGIADIDSVVNVILDAPTTDLTSSGQVIVWTGAGTSTLTGSADGQDIVSITIDNTGEYTVTLEGPLDHSIAGVEDLLSFDVGVTATDGTLSTGGTLTVNVEDDIPEATATSVDLHINPVTTNLSFVVDISRSMSDTDLALTLDGINTLIAEYEAIGTVNVNVVQFYGNGNYNSGWQDSTYDFTLDNTKRGTDIEQGLRTMVEDSYSGNEPVSDQDVVYFFGDGNTYGNYEIDFDAYLPTWEAFIDSGSIDKLFTYSVNTSTVLSDIVKVSYPGEDVVSADAVNISDVATLSEAISETAGVYAEGSVLTDTSGNTIISFGADGGHIESVTIDGNTVVYDPDNIVQTIDGQFGTFTLDFHTGAYTYSATTYIDHTETVSVSSVDNDGDGLDTVLLDINITYDASYESAFPDVPAVAYQFTHDQTPTITGTWDEVAGHTLNVTVNSVTYVLGVDSELSSDGSGNWSLAMLTSLNEGTYDVAVEVTDAAGNLAGDMTNNELVVDVNDNPPVATDDIVLTNITEGDVISISSALLSNNDSDLDFDNLDVITSSNAQAGQVSGTDPVQFIDQSSFGDFAQEADDTLENPLDSEANPLNNDMAHAVEISREQFGQVNGTQAPFVGDDTLPSFKWTGYIDDDGTTSGTTDKDFMKVYLYAGEKIILDVDYGDDGDRDVPIDDQDVDMYVVLYDADGNAIASNDDANKDVGGDGSVQSGYHKNSLDPYLEHEVTEDGYYYINATAWDNSSNGISDDDGKYELWVSIDPVAGDHLSSFDYEISDGSNNDAATVTVDTVAGTVIDGTDSDEILIGTSGQADTLNGAGGDDALLFDIADTIDGGTGYDTLVFDNNETIDFSILADNVNNVERFNLSDSEITINNVNATDVLNVTDSGELTILGGSNDNVTLQGSGWSHDATVIENGHVFNVYSDGGATVKIEQDVNDTIQS